MADYIPSISSEAIVNSLKKHFPDPVAARIPLLSKSFASQAPEACKRWIDPCFDGCDDIDQRRSKEDKPPNEWFEFMRHTPFFEEFGKTEFLEKPDRKQVYAHVSHLLEKCAALKPSWITVPQLPHESGPARNKINRVLADAAGNWKVTNKFAGSLILPLIFTNQNQLNGKMDRNPKVQLAEKCYKDSQASGFWVVDVSLSEETGSASLRGKRFRGIIDCHDELNSRISSSMRMGGPYWGLNLLLWARGLIDYPMIGIGSGFQHFVSGMPPRSPATRIAIPPLRRRVKVGDSLKKWLSATLHTLGPNHPYYAEFDQLNARLHLLEDKTRAKDQIAGFYRSWFDRIAAAPKAGRSMALFQDLSTAYALGKSLSPLDDEDCKRPESVAEPLMMTCL